MTCAGARARRTHSVAPSLQADCIQVTGAVTRAAAATVCVRFSSRSYTHVCLCDWVTFTLANVTKQSPPAPSVTLSLLTTTSVTTPRLGLLVLLWKPSGLCDSLLAVAVMWSPRRSSVFLTYFSRHLSWWQWRECPALFFGGTFCLFACLCDWFTCYSIARLALAFDFIYFTYCILWRFMKVRAQWWANLWRLGHSGFSNATEQLGQVPTLGKFWWTTL